MVLWDGETKNTRRGKRGGSKTDTEGNSRKKKQVGPCMPELDDPSNLEEQ